MLNGRVRNGNGCGHPGMVTGKLHWLSVEAASGLIVDNREYQEGSDKSCSLHGPGVHAGRTGTSKGSMRSSVWLLVPVS